MAESTSKSENIIWHVMQTLIAIGIAGIIGILWAFKDDFSDVRADLAVTKTEILALQEHLSTFRLMVADRYTGSDAERDFEIVHSATKDHEQRIRKLESRILIKSKSDIPYVNGK